MDNDRVEIPGSELKPRSGERLLPAAVPSNDMTVTILLRRNLKQNGPSEQDLLSGKYQAPSRSLAEAALAADPRDIAAVRSFAEQYGLKVVDEDAASRRVRVRASAATMEKAFAVQLMQTSDNSGRQYRAYTGVVSVPKAIGGIVTAVLGLDERSVAVHHGQ